MRADGRYCDGSGSKHIAFVTSAPLEEAQGRARQMVEPCCSKRGIESGYCASNKSRLTATSKDPGVRDVCFLYSLMMYNAWALANAMASRAGKDAVGMVVFQEIAHSVMLQQLAEAAAQGGAGRYARKHRPPPR